MHVANIVFYFISELYVLRNVLGYTAKNNDMYTLIIYILM